MLHLDDHRVCCSRRGREGERDVQIDGKKKAAAECLHIHLDDSRAVHGGRVQRSVLFGKGDGSFMV